MEINYQSPMRAHLQQILPTPQQVTMTHLILPQKKFITTHQTAQPLLKRERMTVHQMQASRCHHKQMIHLLLLDLRKSVVKKLERLQEEGFLKLKIQKAMRMFMVQL